MEIDNQGTKESLIVSRKIWKNVLAKVELVKHINISLTSNIKLRIKVDNEPDYGGFWEIKEFSVDDFVTLTSEYYQDLCSHVPYPISAAFIMNLILYDLLCVKENVISILFSDIRLLSDFQTQIERSEEDHDVMRVFSKKVVCHPKWKEYFDRFQESRYDYKPSLAEMRCLMMKKNYPFLQVADFWYEPELKEALFTEAEDLSITPLEYEPLPGLSLIRIIKVNNPILRDVCEKEIEKLSARIGRENVYTKLVFHGTRGNSPFDLCFQGFDPKKIGQYNCLYGDGVYMAENLKTANRYAHLELDGRKRTNHWITVWRVYYERLQSINLLMLQRRKVQIYEEKNYNNIIKEYTKLGQLWTVRWDDKEDRGRS